MPELQEEPKTLRSIASGESLCLILVVGRTHHRDSQPYERYELETAHYRSKKRPNLRFLAFCKTAIVTLAHSQNPSHLLALTQALSTTWLLNSFLKKSARVIRCSITMWSFIVSTMAIFADSVSWQASPWRILTAFNSHILDLRYGSESLDLVPHGKIHNFRMVPICGRNYCI